MQLWLKLNPDSTPTCIHGSCNLDDTTMTTMTDPCFIYKTNFTCLNYQLEWPTNPHGRMPQSAESAVMYVYVKRFCAAFCSLAM